MRVEIDNIKEVKEVTIAPDGQINSQMPEYAGYIAKIVILNQKGIQSGILKSERNTDRTIESHIETYKIEGKRYAKGQKRTRKTAKEFVRFLSNKLDIQKKSQSWILLKNRTRVRYTNSVVYDGTEGDFLWYSLSYNDLTEHLKEKDALLAFIIRDSHKMIYLRAKDIINELKKARDLRDNDWMHIHLIFINDKIKLHVKTGKGNEPIEREFPKEKHYIGWEKFAKMLGE